MVTKIVLPNVLLRSMKNSVMPAKGCFYSSLTNPSTRCINNIIYAGVALAGAFLIPGGHLTVGGLSVLLAYANQYMKPFNDISSVITELQNALACATRIFDLLEEEPESPDPSGTLVDVKVQWISGMFPSATKRTNLSLKTLIFIQNQADVLPS